MPSQPPEFEGAWAERRIPVLKTKDNEYNWATYIDNRNPRFKIHRTEAHAHAAMSYKFNRNTATAEMVYYERDQDEWVPKVHVRRGDPKTTLPWIPPLPSPEEVTKKQMDDKWRNMLSRISFFFGPLDDDEYRKRMTELQAFINLMKKRRFKND